MPAGRVDSPPSSEHTRRLLQDSIVWDNHGCLPMDPAANRRFLPQLSRYRTAGVTVASINAGYGTMGLPAHLALLGQMREWISGHPGAFLLAADVADIARAKATGRTAIVFDVEGAAPIGTDLTALGSLYELGVRWMLVAYNRTNLVGGGCHDNDPGLTAFGRRWVDEMARVGMVVCLSHAGYRTARDVLEYSGHPVVFSHSNPRALVDHPRNVPDDLIDLCARRGGVIGINGLGLFLGESPPRVATYARHIDHVVQRIGPAHVALGLDCVFDLEGLNSEKASMKGAFPPGCGYEQPTSCIVPEDIPAIVEHLLQRGYRDEDVAAILGGNLLRVAQAVWR